MSDELDTRIRSLLAERMRPMARWRMESATPLTRPERERAEREQAALEAAVVEIEVAERRRVWDELGTENWPGRGKEWAS